MSPHSRPLSLLPVLLLVAVAFLAGVVSASLATAAPPLDRFNDASATESTGGAPSPEATEPAARVPVVCYVDRDSCQVVEDVATGLPFPWVLLGYTIRVERPPDDWHAGVSLHDQRAIVLFVRDTTTVTALSKTLVHEIGHAIHTVCPDRLAQWRERRELPDTVPDHVPAPHDYDSVAEDFSEAFSQYLGQGSSRSTVGDPLTADWLQRNADLFVPCASRPA